MWVDIRCNEDSDPHQPPCRSGSSSVPDRNLKNTDLSAFCYNLLKKYGKYRYQQKIDTNLVKKFHNKSNNKIIKFVEKRLEKCEALKKITYAQLWWVGREYVNPIS